MKTKFMRIYWRDWRKLRSIFPGERGETCAEYMERLTNDFIDYHNLYSEKGGKSEK